MQHYTLIKKDKRVKDAGQLFLLFLPSTPKPCPCRFFAQERYPLCGHELTKQILAVHTKQRTPFPIAESYAYSSGDGVPPYCRWSSACRPLLKRLWGRLGHTRYGISKHGSVLLIVPAAAILVPVLSAGVYIYTGTIGTTEGPPLYAAVMYPF